MARPYPEDRRIELTRQALDLQAMDLTQRQIAARLGVSQPTVCNWLRKHPQRLLTVQERIADNIRRELVCCDIYEQMEDAYNPEDDSAWKALRHSSDYHDICFYGEWAARIAEKVL